MLRSKLASSLKQVFENRSFAAMSRSRRLRREHRNCGTEPLEVRQLLTGDFVGVNAVGSTGNDQATAVTADSAGNVYTTGTFSGTVDFDSGPGTTLLISAGSTDIFVTKVESSGALIWARRMGGTSADGANAIAVDAVGNVYTTGSFLGTADFDPGAGTTNRTSAGFTDIFVSKLDSSGNSVWARTMGGTDFDSASGLAVDAAGNVYTTGFFAATADFDPGAGTANRTSAGLTDIFGSKLDSNGNYVWAWNSGGNFHDSGRAIAVDSTGNVYTTGSYQGTADFDPGINTSNLASVGGGFDIFVSKLDSSGNFVWARSMGGTGFDQAYGIAVDSTGNVYTTGWFTGTVDFDPGFVTNNLSSAGSFDIFVSKLDSNGNYVWARRMGGAGEEQGRDIAVDSAGNVYTTGYFENTVDFDPGAGLSNLISAGANDIFVSKLNSSGNFVWARSMGGTGSDQANGTAVDSAGNVYTAGQFTFTADFDPAIQTANRTSAGSSDAFTLKLSPVLLFEIPAGVTGDLKLVRNGDNLNLLFNGTSTFGSYVLWDQGMFSEVSAVRVVNSAEQAISLTLDYLSGGAFGIDGGIHFAAGAATTDSVRFIGQSNEGFTYAPSSATANAGTMRTYGNEVTFTGVESVFVTKTQALEVETQGSADVLTVSPGTGFQNNLAMRIAGTSGGTTITPLTLDNVRDLTIETGLFDGVLAQSNDTVTFTAGSYEAQGLKNVFVRTGKGNDTLTVNGPDIGLPVPSGAFWFLGGSGIDRLSASGNTNWDLNDTRLVSAGGGRIQHDDIERATLIGGTGKNHLNASLFSGDVTMNGGSDNDLIRGGSGNDTLIGGAGNDRIYGGLGDDNLQGQDDHDQIWGDAGEDILTGGIGNDQLWGGDDNDDLAGEAGNDILRGGSGDDSLSGGDNNDQLFGDAGNDIVNGGNHNDKLFGGDGADTLNGDAGNDFLSGGTGDDALAGGAGIDLYDLQGTNNAEDLRLQRVNATSASFRRKPRGLSSILELDSITMDTTDEFWVSALGGDDLITIDSLFTQLGSVDGGDGTDVCTGPAAWVKVSG